MTKTDRVRAALEYAAHEATNEYWREQYKKTLSELDGMVLAPVEPTDLMIEAAAKHFNTTHDGTVFMQTYAAMIAPYVEGE